MNIVRAVFEKPIISGEKPEIEKSGSAAQNKKLFYDPKFQKDRMCLFCLTRDSAEKRSGILRNDLGSIIFYSRSEILKLDLMFLFGNELMISNWRIVNFP